MSELKVGDKFEMVWPFYLAQSVTGWTEPEVHEFWVSGCVVHTEEYGHGYGQRFFNCNAEGVISYEVLSIAEMPCKYQDRIVFKVTKTDPDGNQCGRGDVRMLTKKSFLRDVEMKSPFKADYEVDASFDLTKGN